VLRQLFEFGEKEPGLDQSYKSGSAKKPASAAARSQPGSQGRCCEHRLCSSGYSPEASLCISGQEETSGGVLAVGALLESAPVLNFHGLAHFVM